MRASLSLEGVWRRFAGTPGDFSRWTFFPWLLLAFLSALTLAAWSAERRIRRADHRAASERAAVQAASEIRIRLENYSKLLWAGEALFRASERVEPHEWRTFVHGVTDAEVLGMGTLRPDGSDLARIEYLEFQPGMRRAALPAETSWPLAAGVPLASLRDPIFSGVPTPLRDRLPLGSALLLHPMGSSGSASDALPPARWIFLIFRLAALLESARAGLPENSSLILWDATDPGSRALLAAAGSAVPGESFQASFLLHDRRLEWEVTLPREPVGAFHPIDGVFLAGLAACVGVFLLVRSDAVRRRRMAQLAERMAASYLQSEKDYRTLMEQAADGIFVSDLKGNYLDVNEGGVRLLGYSREELLGMNLRDLIPPEERASNPPRMAELLEGKTVVNEQNLLRKDGSRVPVEISARRIEGDRLLSVVRDATERKRAEEVLRASEERYRRLVEALPEAVVVHRNGRFLYANPAALRMFGAKGPEDLVDRPIDDVIHPDYREKVRWRMAATEGLEKNPPLEQKLVRLDGTVFDGEGMGMTVPFGDGSAQLAVLRDITDRKRTERILHENEDRLRRVLTAIPVLLWAVDRNGLITLSEGSGLQEAGLKPGELVGQSIWDVCRDYPHILEDVRRALSGESFHNVVEFGGLTYESWYAPLRNEAGETEGFLAVSTNITSRLESERRLREHERFLNTLMANLPGMVYRCRNTPQWPMEFVSEGALDLTGYDPADFTSGRVSFGEIIAPEDRARLWTDVQEALKHRQPFSISYRIRSKNGNVKWVAERGRQTGGGAGASAVLEGFITDVTDLKRAEEDLRILAVQLKLHAERRRVPEGAGPSRFFELSPDLFCVEDYEGRFLEVNRAWEETLGYRREELLALRVRDLVHPEDWGRTQALARTLWEPGQAVSMENRYRAKDGTYKWLLWSALGYPDDGKIYAVARDITDRKFTEQRLLDLAGRLQEANQDLEAFSYSVSHDLRAPLRSLHGFAEALIEDFGKLLPEKGRHYATRVVENARRMEHLIQDLLALGRAGRRSLEMRSLDISKIFDRVRRDLLSREPEGRRIHLEALDGLPPARGDEGLVTQVFENLLSNALKFTRGRREARIEVGGRSEEGDRVVYWVRDNGVGFEAAQAERLFAPFHRLHADDAFEGTGVGLALVQRIVQRHGGRVWAEGEKEKGAVFYFTLPTA